MRSGLLRLLFSLSGGLFLLLPLPAAAQSVASAAPFTLSASPTYPAPFSQVAISAVSTSLNLTNATLTLSVNGTKLYQGNPQPIAVTVGGAGTVSLVRATITSNGASYTQTLLLQPEDVALVAEPVSSAPPLYPGKPLIPLEGSVRVVAIANLKNANGKALDPMSLSYSWTLDGTRLADASGIGKSAAIVDSPLQYRGRSVSLVVQSQDGALVGGASLDLSASQPVTRIYENDPLLGIRFEHALSGAYAINGAESSLYGAAYSFPLTNGGPALQWFLNGGLVQSGSAVTLRPTGSGQGSASLSLVGAAGSYTKTTTSLSVSFGTKSGSSLFGL